MSETKSEGNGRVSLDKYEIAESGVCIKCSL